MDISAPSQLTELNTTATERLQRYLNNYDSNIINNWRFQANQRFEDELTKYNEVKENLMAPFEIGAALPEFNHLVRKGGKKIDDALKTIKELKDNPKNALDMLEEGHTGFGEFTNNVNQFKTNIENTFNNLKKAPTSIENTEPNPVSIELKDMAEIRQQQLQQEEASRASGLGLEHNDPKSTSEFDDGASSSNGNRLKQLQNQNENVEEIEKDDIEGVDRNTPSVEEEGGIEATEAAEGAEAVAEGAAEAGAVEAGLGAFAEVAGPVGVAAALGYGLYNLFSHGLHTPHPTKLSNMPSPKLPNDINFNSIIRPHVNAVMDHSSGLTNF